jgi:hypothetical protein
MSSERVVLSSQFYFALAKNQVLCPTLCLPSIQEHTGLRIHSTEEKNILEPWLYFDGLDRKR